MATLSACLNELSSLKRVTGMVKDSCIQTRSDLFKKTASELSALNEAATDVQFTVYRPDFKNAPNNDKYLNDIIAVAKDGLLKLQDFTTGLLSHYGQSRRESGQRRAEKAVDTQKLELARSEFANVTRSYRRIVDAINGREDWSKLTPKAPVAPTSSASRPIRDRSMPPPPRPTHLTSQGPATSSKGSISVPPSPFQPSIEDVEDDPEEESRNVQSYHLDPKETIAAANLKAAGKQPILPQVFVRAPTELSEDMIPRSPIGNETPKMPLKSAMKKSPNSSGGSSQSPSPRSAADSSPKGELVQTSSTSTAATSTTSSLEEQIRQLQAELASVKASGDSSPQPHPMMRSSSQRSNRLSVDFDSRPTFMEPPKPFGRPRASTTTSTSADRPSAHRTGSESYVRRRTPRQSPRESSSDYPYVGSSPQAIPRPYPSPRLPQSPPLQQDGFGFSSQFQPGSYGQEHRASLSTVLEQQPSSGPRRTPRPSPRFSGTFDDFNAADVEGGTGDFELFGPASQDHWMSPRERPHGARTPQLPRDDSWTPVMEHKLVVSLEQLYFGEKLKAKINRKVVDASLTRYTQHEHTVSIPVSRGLKKGSIIKLKGVGDITPAGNQDIDFVIDEAPHAQFTRSGNDLHTTLEIPLLESLLGWERTIPTICGKKLRISEKGLTGPDWKSRVPGFGMCQRKNVETRGDLIVAVTIKYPREISDRQKRLVLEAFGERA